MLVPVLMFKHGFDWRIMFLYKTEIFRKKCSYSILEVWLYWNHSKRTEIKSRLIDNYNKLLTITNSNSNFHLHVSFPILIIKSQRNHSNKTQPSCPTRAAACASGSPARASEQEAGLDANTHTPHHMVGFEACKWEPLFLGVRGWPLCNLRKDAWLF